MISKVIFNNILKTLNIIIVKWTIHLKKFKEKN